MISNWCFSQYICITTTLYGIILFHAGCQPQNDPNEMKFSLFNPGCGIDTFISNNNMYIYKTNAYLITGFQNTAAHESKIDSFVCSLQDSTWGRYNECRILIYKKSKHTNNEYISKNPRDLDRYSMDNDFLYWYTWGNGIVYSKVAIKGKKYYDDVMCK